MQFEVWGYFLRWAKKKQHFFLETLVTNIYEREGIDFCSVQINGDISTLWFLITPSNIPKDRVTQLQSKQQSCIHLLYESLFGQCEYTTQLTGSFWCHVIDTKGAVLLLIFRNEFVFIVMCLSFSFIYLVELKLFQSLKNEATWS